MIAHINKLFFAIIIISLFTYFERPDYNLPLFAFIILLWENSYVKQKTRLWYLMAVSLVVDLIWIIYWAATWKGYDNRELGLCNFTIFLSSVNLVLKLIAVILTFVKEDECKKSVTEFPANVKYVFSGPNEYHPLNE